MLNVWPESNVPALGGKRPVDVTDDKSFRVKLEAAILLLELAAENAERVVVTVQEHANTSAASIPLALDIAVRDGRVQRGNLLLLEGFGAGFTWGSTLLYY